jgi:uncharacterized protein with HEPN domain
LRNERDRLLDILERTEELLKTAQNFTRESFESDRYVYQATLRDIEIVGEAVKNLPEEFKTSYPNVPWRAIGRVRDLLAHVYFAIKPDRIWEILDSDISDLDSAIRKILEELPKE